MYACLYGSSPRLTELAQRFSPLVEPVDSDLVVFSIAGLERLIGDERQIASEISRQGAQWGIMANLAIAANPSAAVLAARNIAGVTIIPPGQEAEALASLPIAVLPATPELATTLSRWGVRTLGALAALPEIGLTERLGLEGSRLRKLALGRDDSILNIRPPEPEYLIRQQLEDPIELLEPLLFIVSGQLHALASQLERNGHATNRIAIDLTLECGELRRELALPIPMRDARALLKQVQLALEANPPQAPILAVQIALDPVEPRVSQNGLFLPVAPQPEKLQSLLARLRALLGEEHIGSPVNLNTHRPDAYRLRPCAFDPSTLKGAGQDEQRLAFRYFRPPLTAHVTLRDYRLQRIASERVTGEIVQSAGPWRTSGDWWTSRTAWQRNEWDIVLEDRAVYRIYCTSGRWFLEGNYD